MAAELRHLILAAATLLAPAAAAAQDLSASAEIATDDRRRGLSWSDGRAVVSGALAVQAPGGWDASVRATTTRNSTRHAGADGAFDVEGGYALDAGALRFDARVIGHLFAGAREAMDYVEVGAGAGLLYGPVQLDLYTRYAPPADAIGGDNLYLAARASAGIPATPYTVTAGIGRSSGSVDDPVRAARLRPAGRYHDWQLSVARITGPVTVAVEYTGTDVDEGPSPSPFAVRRHASDRITLRAGLSF